MTRFEVIGDLLQRISHAVRLSELQFQIEIFLLMAPSSHPHAPSFLSLNHHLLHSYLSSSQHCLNFRICSSPGIRESAFSV